MAKDSLSSSFERDFFKQAGKRGGKLGGKKAAENMTPEERSERAKKAVSARKWHPPVSEKEKAKRLASKRPVGRPKKRQDRIAGDLV